MRSWIEANQRYLTAEINVLKQELRLYRQKLQGAVSEEHLKDWQDSIVQVEKALEDLPFPAAIDSLVATFSLCGASDLDTEFADLIGQLQGGSSFFPSFGLALSLFEGAHWSAITPDAPLRYWGIIELQSGSLVTKSPLLLNEYILHFLCGTVQLDATLREITVSVSQEYDIVPSHFLISNSVSRLLQDRLEKGKYPTIELLGDDASDKGAIAANACGSAGLSLYSLEGVSIPTNNREAASLARIWSRQAALNRLVLLIDCNDIDLKDNQKLFSIRYFIGRLTTPVIISSRNRFPSKEMEIFLFEVTKPKPEEQLALWASKLGDTVQHNRWLQSIVSQFNMSAGKIHLACKELQNKNGTSKSDSNYTQDIRRVCCAQTRPEVEQLAELVEPHARWEDLILPEAHKSILKEIVIQVKQKSKVYHDWGFSARNSRGLGITALFSGESGTGKTMAAEVLANELQLDLYKIDLSQVISKYIGETEKKLKKIFDAAEEGGSILLFDEADALFGKRSEVKDSHDRYSNIEVSYLLQRMEAYRGLAILTTNMKGALDRAFMRRIRFVVQFPFPDTIQRTEIWRTIFPTETPTQDLDYDKLARLNLAGGNIRNIAMNAAFIAAEEECPILMSHISRAARSEYSKLEKILGVNEIAKW
jgi:ATP-dependent 26S proteasome regulatory subunit